jgi:hypothetical protein
MPTRHFMPFFLQKRRFDGARACIAGFFWNP